MTAAALITATRCGSKKGAPGSSSRHDVTMPPRRPLTKSEIADLVDQMRRIREAVHRVVAALKRRRR